MDAQYCSCTAFVAFSFVSERCCNGIEIQGKEISGDSFSGPGGRVRGKTILLFESPLRTILISKIPQPYCQDCYSRSKVCPQPQSQGQLDNEGAMNG